ncbi:hypothetical protein U0070_019618 [Myodes glareolus]|uniref:Uncharacterized protein n=1 Tax=Myodes glareolus TaxID=447135 RepID=A0AAW0JLG5_MYOGA
MTKKQVVGSLWRHAHRAMRGSREEDVGSAPGSSGVPNVQKHHKPIDGHSKEENPEPHSRLSVYRKTNLHPLLLEAEKK